MHECQANVRLSISLPDDRNLEGRDPSWPFASNVVDLRGGFDEIVGCAKSEMRK